MALSATAIQYNTYSAYYASRAVDGSTTMGSCSDGVTGQLVWWAVDLGYQQHVNVVQVAGDVYFERNDFSSFL